MRYTKKYGKNILSVLEIATCIITYEVSGDDTPYAKGFYLKKHVIHELICPTKIYVEQEHELFVRF